MRILLTGFEPFGQFSTNSSWEVAQAVAKLCTEEQTDCRVEQLPVSFGRVGDTLRCLIAGHQPDVVLMLGQASSADSIRLERVTLNLMDARGADNDGFAPSELPIDEVGEAAYFTRMPIKQLREALLNEGVEATISNSAGLYVCNRTYYEALRLVAEGTIRSALFVHLPCIKEESGWSVEKMCRAVMIIIRNL